MENNLPIKAKFTTEIIVSIQGLYKGDELVSQINSIAFTNTRKS